MIEYSRFLFLEQVHGHVPMPHDIAAAQAVLDLVKKAKAELGIDAEIDEELVRLSHFLYLCYTQPDRDACGTQVKKIARTSSAVLAPLASIFGGIVGQEVAKAVGSGALAEHCLFISHLPVSCCLMTVSITMHRSVSSTTLFISISISTSPRFYPTIHLFHRKSSALDPAAMMPKSQYWAAQPRFECVARYSPFIAEIVSFYVQARLESLKYFMVGCGALGCELLKNFAMMGLGSGADGRIVVTDDDVIEKSNLSRQFLFRNHNVGQSKSQAASRAVLGMNPALKIDARQV